MRFFAIGQEAEGFIAIGQIATGVIAIGQMATGVIAIGQVARGVVAVGMLAFGVISLGMLSGGLVWAAGMVGAGGRAGFGAIIPLVPVPRAQPKLPELASLESIRASRREGWVLASLRVGASGLPELVHEGVTLPVNLAAKLLGAATTHAQLANDVVARVAPTDDGLRVLEMKVIPKGSRWIGRAIQIVLLVAITYAYWTFVFVDLGDMVVGTARAFLHGQVE